MNKRIFKLIVLIMGLALLLGASGVEAQKPTQRSTYQIWDSKEERAVRQQAWNVRLVGQIDLVGDASDVVVVGDYAYVAEWIGLHIIDVSIPTTPSKIGLASGCPSPTGLAVAGNYAYVACDIEGLTIIDVSNPAAPSIAKFQFGDQNSDIAVAGNYAYLTDLMDGGLRIIDVSNPAAPTESGFYDIPGGATAVAVAGNYAFVAAMYGGLHIIDVSNPAAPSETGFYDTPGGVRDVALAGKYAYVADGSNVLRIINVSNPAVPFEAGFYDKLGSAVGVALARNYAYVVDYEEGLRIIDVSNPAAPTESGFYDMPWGAIGVSLAGGLAYVADYSNGLFILRFYASDLAATGITSRVSLASDGTQGDDNSYGSAISADGRFVAFQSRASNLVVDDTNGAYDIFLHDTHTGETARVSISSDGGEGDGYCYWPSISADGRFVAFESVATNLVSDDTNDVSDIFLHDTKTGETSRVSISSDGTQGNGESHASAISADGRFVAFHSLASNLVVDDSNGAYDVFLHDTHTGETTRVSISSEGTQGNYSSYSPAISADGRFVAYDSLATNLVSDDTNNYRDTFLHDTHTGETTRVSISSEGTQGDEYSCCPSISADGSFVTFQSGNTNLISGDTNDVDDVFLHDTNTGETTRVSISSDGTQGDGNSIGSTISADGHFVAFYSEATNLVRDDTNNDFDVFLHNTHTGETTRVSLSSEGGEGDLRSFSPAISADGRFIAFDSEATNLVSDDTNNSYDVFLYIRNIVSNVYIPVILK